MKLFVYTLILVMAELSSSPAHAQIDAVSRLSRISRNTGGAATDEIQSTSFDTFDEMLFGSGNPSFFPVANQISTFDNLTANVNTDLQNIGTSNFGGGSISASSTFELTFDLAVRSEFQISAVLTENDVIEEFGVANGGGAFFRLDGPAELEFESNFSSDTIIDEIVELPSGRYTLQIGSVGFGSDVEPAADSTASATFQFIRSVPEPSSTFAIVATFAPFLLRRRRQVVHYTR